MIRPAPPIDRARLPAWQRYRRTAARVVWVASLFCLVMAASLVINHARMRSVAPLESPALAALRQKLAAQPQDEHLKQAIRQSDLALREALFACQARAWWGGRLLAGGLAVLLISLYCYRRFAPLPPVPQRGPQRDAALARTPRHSRRAVAVLAAGSLLLPAVVWALTPPPPPIAAEPVAAAAVAEPGGDNRPPTPAQLARNWPRFRGPDGGGRTLTALPAPWPPHLPPKILWSLPLSRPGNSSPIVWDRHVFLTSADAANRELIGVDLDSGRQLWLARADRIHGSNPEPPEVMEQTGFAAPSPATDGRRVFALFANGDLLATTLDGRRAWTRALGLPENHYGHAASLFTWEDTLFVPWDRANAASLLALDSATGNTRYEKSRPVQVSWSTPILVSVGGSAQLITSAVPRAMAYRPADGTELWFASGLKGEFGASPVYDGRRVYALAPESALVALEPPASAAAPAAAHQPVELQPAWQVSEDLPDTTSPVADGERVWTLTSAGRLCCYRAADGTRLYRQDLNADFSASPLCDGQRLLLVSADGQLFLIACADQYQLLATADLGEPVAASPALVPGRLLIRSAAHLFCLEVPAVAATPAVPAAPVAPPGGPQP